MHRKIIGSVLLGLCMFANSALAALPKEGVYEKHSAAGTLEARMFVMGEHGATKYTFGYGNDYTQIIWLEGYTFNGERHSEFATKYVWKTDSVGAAETALILDREGIENLKNGDIIIYSTEKGQRKYKVSLNKVIKETDWTYIQNTKDNRLTLITCEMNKKEYRRCVQAVEI